MSDIRVFVPNSATDAGMPSPWLKLVDNGDGTFSYPAVLMPYSFRNISGAATTVVKTGSGVLKSVIFNKIVSSSICTIYDNTAGSGTKIATITAPLALLQQQASILYDLAFNNGLTLVTSSTDDITVVYR